MQDERKSKSTECREGISDENPEKQGEHREAKPDAPSAGKCSGPRVSVLVSGGKESKTRTPNDGEGVKLRALTLEDLIGAQEEVSASVSSDATSMNELQRWNEMYGEGGNRRNSTLTYFM